MKRLHDWMRVALLDLRGDLRRFGVLIACLALGTAAIAAVGSVGGALKGAVVREATTLMGGDLEVSRPDRDATPEELAFLQTLGQVVQVVDTNARATAVDTNALATAGENNAFVDLVAVGDTYPMLGAVVSPQLPEGEKPATLLNPADGALGALVDPNLLEELGIPIGGEFLIGETAFQVRGTLTSIPDGAVRGFHLGLTTLISTAALENLRNHLRPALPGLLTQHRYKVLLTGGQESYDTAATAIALQFNDPDWTIRSPREAAGSLARYYDLFSRYLLIVGLSSLLVGGVGVYTGVSAYVGERQRSIATMRSLGATSARILVHFLTQVGMLAAIGVLIGIIAGGLSSAVALPTIGKALGINLPPTIEFMPLLSAIGFGLLAGFAFSYLPLVRAQQVSPALLFRSLGSELPKPGAGEGARWPTYVPLVVAAGGIYLLAVAVTADFSLVNYYSLGVILAFMLLRVASWLLQQVLRLAPAPSAKRFRYALRNIRRPGSTAPVVIMSLGLGLSMLLVITLLNSNLREQLLGAVAKDAPTFVATDLFDDEIATLEDMAETDPTITAFKWYPSIRARITKVAGVEARSIRDIDDEVSFLLGSDMPVTWRADMPTDGAITDGEWWPPDYSGPPLISLRSSLKTSLGLKVGDIVTFSIFGDTVDARIANFRDYPWQNGLNFGVVFSPGDIESYPLTFLGTIKAAEGQEKTLERTLAKQFPEVAFIPIGEALKQAVRFLGQLAAGVNIVGGLAVINGLLVLAGTLAAGRKQREQDSIIHKVLGATRADVLWVFALEYALLGAFAALMATVIGIVAAWSISQSMLAVGFIADGPLITLVVMGAIAVTVIAGALTTWRSLSTSPAQYLRGN